MHAESRIAQCAPRRAVRCTERTVPSRTPEAAWIPRPKNSVQEKRISTRETYVVVARTGNQRTFRRQGPAGVPPLAPTALDSIRRRYLRDHHALRHVRSAGHACPLRRRDALRHAAMSRATRGATAVTSLRCVRAPARGCAAGCGPLRGACVSQRTADAPTLGGVSEVACGAAGHGANSTQPICRASRYSAGGTRELQARNPSAHQQSTVHPSERTTGRVRGSPARHDPGSTRASRGR